MAERAWSNFSISEWNDFTLDEYSTFLLDPTTSSSGFEGNIYGTGYFYSDFTSTKHFSGNIYGTGTLVGDLNASSTGKYLQGKVLGSPSNVYFQSFLDITKHFESSISGSLIGSGLFSILKDGYLDLYIGGTIIQEDQITLYIKGVNPTIYGVIPLYLCNYGISSGLPLIIEGEGSLPGSIPFTDNITLFIGDHNKLEGELPLFISSYTGNSSGNLDLFIKSSNLISSGLDLTMFGYDTKTESLALFSYGY